MIKTSSDSFTPMPHCQMEHVQGGEKHMWKEYKLVYHHLTLIFFHLIYIHMCTHSSFSKSKNTTFCTHIVLKDKRLYLGQSMIPLHYSVSDDWQIHQLVPNGRKNVLNGPLHKPFVVWVFTRHDQRQFWWCKEIRANLNGTCTSVEGVW